MTHRGWLPFVMVLALIGCDTQGCTKQASLFGRFEGRVLAEWEPDGRFMTLREDFRYIDPSNKVWLAPSGSRVNGASIPKPFWSVIGGPFEGKYRNASVVHDVYCESKQELSEAVHEMFYQGCRCGGVEESQAKLMYWAVYRFGPRWTIVQTIDGQPEIAMAVGAEEPDAEEVRAAQEYFKTHNPSLEQIRELDLKPE